MSDDKDIRPFLPPIGERLVLPSPDPRDPDYSRPGIFAHHNCWKCQDGKLPCAQGTPNQCEYPIARNH